MTPARLDRRRGIAGAVLIAGWAARSSRPHSGAPAIRARGAVARRYTPRTMPQGTAIVIGGAEDKVRDRVILGRFVALAGGADAKIAVISTASSLGTEAGQRYREVFTELGAADVRPLHAVTRTQANDESVAAVVRDATGIFLTGGNQLRLSSMVGGTRLADAILTRFREGAVVAGHVRRGLRHLEPHDRLRCLGRHAQAPHGADRRRPRAAPGGHRGPALPAAEPPGTAAQPIAQNPMLLGLGVDEDTAGVVGPDQVMEVIGRGSITVVDGAASDTDAWEIRGHSPADDQQRHAAQPARGLPLRPPPPHARSHVRRHHDPGRRSPRADGRRWCPAWRGRVAGWFPADCTQAGAVTSAASGLRGSCVTAGRHPVRRSPCGRVARTS